MSATNSDVHLTNVLRPLRGVAQPAPTDEYSTQAMGQRLHHGSAVEAYLFAANMSGNTGEYILMPSTCSGSPGSRRRLEQCTQQQYGDHGQCRGLGLWGRRE